MTKIKYSPIYKDYCGDGEVYIGEGEFDTEEEALAARDTVGRAPIGIAAISYEGDAQ